MVKVYRIPLLATWHLRYANPALAKYLPKVTELITDGDMLLQTELADDDISEVRELIKSILRDGKVSSNEAVILKNNVKTLRTIADNILSAATYLENREVDEV